jgi:O-antigen ligase
MSVAWQEKLGIWQSWLLVGMVFSLPFHSELLTNLLLLFILTFWLIEGRFAEKWLEMRQHPLFYPMMAYAALYPLSLLWTENTGWAVTLMSERHVIYWFFPILLTIVKKEHLIHYLTAFVLAMTISEGLSYLVWFQVISVPNIDPLDPAGFLGHWVYNPFLALAVYIMGYRLFFTKTNVSQKVFFSFFIITMTVNMFITGGRIGQLTFFALMFLLVVQLFYFKQMLLKGIAFAISGLVVVFLLAYNTSTIFHDRVSLAVEEIAHHDQTKKGSVNTRFIMWQKSWELFLTQPVLGSGVGDYPEDYNRHSKDAIPDTAMMGDYNPETRQLDGTRHMQPHNQYLFDLASFGLLGFSILLWMLYRLAIVAWQRDDVWRPIRLGIVLLVLMVNLTDSYLLVHQSFAYLFVILVATFWSARKDVYS